MISVSDVTAIIVTRGDVDLTPIIDSIVFDHVVTWNNLGHVDHLTRGANGWRSGWRDIHEVADLGAYGRYKAIERTGSPLIYFQDDDCVVTREAQMALLLAYDEQHRAGVRFVSNMNPNHNGGQYPHLALPGYGSICDRHAPEDAFARWRGAHPDDWGSDDFLRVGCDIVFPVMTTSRMINLGHESLPYAYGDGRTYRRADYRGKKASYYKCAAALRGAA